MNPTGTKTRTTCPYCGVGCGVIAARRRDGSVAVQGDPAHPANLGRLCSKGTALGDTLALSDRLLYPEVAGARASWEEALDAVAQGLATAIKEHGPDSVAFYVSGQILTEDYYVANKLMKGFIGSGNIDTNSRLCMASSVAAHRRAFGADTVPATYTDLEQADLVVLVGSNLAWCHPVLYQRVLAAREVRGTRLVVIDPRRTMTADAADLHLALEPDTDVALFLGLLDHLEATGARDEAYVAHHTVDSGGALAAAGSMDVATVAEITGIEPGLVARFFEMFRSTERVVTLFSQGVNQSVCGTDKANAIINCHLLTGRIGKPGASPFSITGQPNAMGGREVGGLANTLAAHMAIEDPAARDRVQRFWRSPTIASRAGLKAVDLFDAVRAGRIKALWIMGTNPVDSIPDAGQVEQALRACPMVVVSDAIRETDTTRFADILLPSLTWGEKDGTVTNSERRISRQRAFLDVPGEARADWWQMAEVAKRLGYSGFAFDGPAAIFREHAALSSFENAGTRDFDIGGYADVGSADYADMTPFLWPAPSRGAPEQPRLFGSGGFYHPDGRARMVATPLPGVSKPRDPAHPLWLNTGRVRDQWHTMTRSGKAPRLMGQYGEPFCEIHPRDAEAFGIRPAHLLEVESTRGRAIVRALVTDRQKAGSVFMAMHWTDRFAAKARADALVDPMCDPVSGQPGLKRTPVAIRPFAARWYGYAVMAERPDAIAADYWAIAPSDGGFRIELAGQDAMDDWQAFAHALFKASPEAEWISYWDREAGIVRLAAFDGQRLLGALFVAPEPVAIGRGFVAAALTREHDGTGRFQLLAGQGGAEQPDPGAIVCACFAIGINQITAAIRAGAVSVRAIGEALQAGTNCGSCRSDLQMVLNDARPAKAG